MNDDYPLLRIKLQGNLIDQGGVNIYHLGRFLQSSQELLNVSASNEIRREIPLEQYTSSIYLIEHYYRRLFVQGHLGTAKQGSLDILINLVAQPELRAFLSSDSFHSFGISVLANLFTSMTCILFRRRGKNQEPISNDADRTLAIHLAPHLEKITRCITPRGGIERIELKADESNSSSKLHLIVDRSSRDKVLDFVESVPPQNISIAGEIRSVDLDRGTAVIADAISGERYELKENDNIRFDRKLLGQHVYIKGNLFSVIKRRGVGTRVEVASIMPLKELALK
ncbi:hypothetical protein KA005_74640 [bacterium]|nr:hypothetical protein [bacterium]